MKIVHIFEHPGSGGAEEVALNLAILAKEQHHVSFILGSEGPLSQKLQKAQIPFVVIPMESSFNPLKVVISTFKLKNYFKNESTDIVHTHMLREQSLVVLAKIFGAKVSLIRTFHRLDQFNWKMKPLLAIYNAKTDAFIAISDYIAKHLKEKGIKRTATIYNGVSNVNKTKEGSALGFMGRLTKEKGIYNFIASNIDNLKETELVVAGDGPEREKIKILVEKEGLRVKLLGNVDKKEDFFNRIKVLILPSETEVMPLVVLEAFSAGVPVVGFDLPSLRDLITGTTGKLIDVGNYTGLAKESMAISESQAYKEFNISTQNVYGENFTCEKMWEKTESLYKRLKK